MKNIPLKNSNKKAVVDDDVYELVSAYRWYFHPRGYAVCYQNSAKGKNKKNIFLHTFIMNPEKGKTVDHENHDGLDCRRDNMRVCTHSQNHGNKNKPKTKNATSKYKGVSWDATYKKWFALICCQGKQYFCGRHENEIDAARAYDKKARELFGEFALVNLS